MKNYFQVPDVEDVPVARLPIDTGWKVLGKLIGKGAPVSFFLQGQELFIIFESSTQDAANAWINQCAQSDDLSVPDHMRLSGAWMIGLRDRVMSQPKRQHDSVMRADGDTPPEKGCECGNLEAGHNHRAMLARRQELTDGSLPRWNCKEFP